MNVLIIEDNPGDAAHAKRMFDKYSEIHVMTDIATRLSEGVTKVRDNQYDAILVDPGLPNSTGLGAVKTIIEETDTAVIVLTGHATIEDMEHSIEMGAAGYWNKGEINLERFVWSVVQASRKHDHERMIRKKLSTRIDALSKRIESLEIWRRAFWRLGQRFMPSEQIPQELTNVEVH